MGGHIRRGDGGMTAVDGLILRLAEASDGDALCRIEAACPMELRGDHGYSLDRSPDYFAAFRILSDADVVIAELSGEIVGAVAGVLHEGRIQGQCFTFLAISRLRVRAEFRRLGVASALVTALTDHFAIRGVDSPYYCVAPGNAASQGLVTAEHRWPVQPVLLNLPIANLPDGTASARGREARLRDAADWINHAHRDEALFAPYNDSTLSARLSRCRRLYSAVNLHWGNGVVAGIWPGGEVITRESHQAEMREVKACVLDFGWADGRGAEDLRDLLCALTPEMEAAGQDAFSLATWTGSAVHDVLGVFASDVEVFDLWTPWLAPPAHCSGIHVDHLVL